METVNAAEPTEYHESHPLVSLVSACFWVICKFEPFCSGTVTDVLICAFSVGSIMGKIIDRLCDDNCSSPHLLCSVLLYDFNGMIIQ
jgi:hypothetical protein